LVKREKIVIRMDEGLKRRFKTAYYIYASDSDTDVDYADFISYLLELFEKSVRVRPVVY